MKMLIVGAAFSAALIAPVSAETQHDRKLEQAMMNIVAARIGNIRGGFAYDRVPEFVTVQDMVNTGSIAMKPFAVPAETQPMPGLVVAVERRVSRVISF